MPEKEGAEEKTTKDVVNKKQKQMMNKEEYTTEMVRNIKKKISARAVFPTVAQNKVKGEIIKGDDLKIDNKNPVKKKKQKDYFGEEGYDIARDEGRVRPSKDKKDATTMPPSKEMKKTQKVNKGPSALERVKADIEKKYGKGAIMNVKKNETKEELDLTQVAESFGGYIIESDVDDEGNIISKKGEVKKIKKKISKIEKEITTPKPGEKAIEKSIVRKNIKTAKKMMSGKTDPIVDKEMGALGKTGAKVQKEIETETGRKTRKFTPASGTGLEPNVDDGTQSRGGKVTTYKIGDKPPEGKVAKVQRLKNRKPRTIPFKFKRTYSPEVQKKVDAVMKGIEARKTLNPDKRSSKRVSASGTPFKIPSKPKSTPLVFTNRPKGVGDTGTGLRKSLKQFKIDADSFDKKLKSLKKDIKQTKTQVKQIPKPTSSDPDVSRMSDADQKKYRKIKDTTPKGGIPNWMKDFDKKRKEVQQQPYQKGVKPAFKRAVLTKGKGLRGLASKVVRNPVGTAIAAGIAKDSFRMPQLPPIPTVKGGRVGRRTAG